MISVKVHQGLVALSDANLIGKHFEEGNLALDVSERFYKGDILEPSAVVKILHDPLNLNLVGKEVIALALKENIIKQEDIITISGVPHAQVYILI